MPPRLSLGAGLPRHDSVFAKARHRSSCGAGISAASLPVLMRRIITPLGVDKTLSVNFNSLTGYIVRHQEVSNVRPCLDRGARHRAGETLLRRRAGAARLHMSARQPDLARLWRGRGRLVDLADRIAGPRRSEFRAAFLLSRAARDGRAGVPRRGIARRWGG